MSKRIKKNLLVETLLNMFVKYKNEKKEEKNESFTSAEQYKQVRNAFAVEEAFRKNTCAERNLLDLLPKLIQNKGGVEKIKQFLNNIENKALKYDWEKNGKKSYRTYLIAFIDYVKFLINDEANIEEAKAEFLKITTKNNLRINATDQALLNNEEGEIYLHSQLKTKFKSRLRRQERTSGDKIWLPLDFIAKIYNPENTKQSNAFTQWIDSMVDNIYIQYKDNNNLIKSITFNNNKNESNVYLKLNNLKDNENKETGEYEVYVGWSENGVDKRFQVYTPTGRGIEKKPMIVKNINEIAIDHVKSIDQTLRDLEKKLRCLKKVSDLYKELPDDEEINSNVIKELGYIRDKLTKDLYKISADSPLRLMASKYNSQKSNGDTFKEIRKIADDKYIGIIEEGIKMDNNPNGENMTLYQELTDALSQTGNLTIAYNSKSLNGQNVNKIPKFKLEDIINRI